jgi:hypothetical protein
MPKFLTSAYGGTGAAKYIAAKTACIGTGGVIEQDEQSLDILTLATMYPATNSPLPMALNGLYSTLRIGTGSGVVGMQFQNTSAILRDYIFRPVDFTPATVDCGAFVWVNSAGPARFENIGVYAVRASDAVFRIGPTERAVFDTVDFLGCAGGNAVVNVTHGASVTFRNGSFWDFGNFGTTGQVGKIQNSGTCVKAVANTTPVNGATYYSRAEFHDWLFDEGYEKHLDIDGYHEVDVRRCGMNMPIVNTGYSMHLKNCDSVIMKKVNICAVNSTTAGYDRPLMKITNCGKVRILGLTNEGTYPMANPRIETDFTTDIELIDCQENIEITRVA